MQPSQFYQALSIDKSPLEALGFNPYYQPLEGLGHGRPRIKGKPYFDLASNDYLGLASDGRIQSAIIDAVQKYGSSMCGTPIATGYAEILAELERTLSRFAGLEAAVVFPSCYQANVALFSTIATAQDVIIVDHYAHASLAHGIKSVGCKVKPFLHNDLAHLEKQLAVCQGFRQAFVVTESVFSTEGSIAPLEQIADLCKSYNAIPVVDDSHGIGVLGETGRGILEHEALGEYDGIYTASLGKALANAGGMIGGKRVFIEALRYSCPGLIYSTALPPASIAGTLGALRIIEQEYSRLRDRLWGNHQRLCDRLSSLGFGLHAGKAPIAAIRSGAAENTLRLAKEFFDCGILATPFVPPSVPLGRGVLRLIVGAKLNAQAVEALMLALNSTRCETKSSSIPDKLVSLSGRV